MALSSVRLLGRIGGITRREIAPGAIEIGAAVGRGGANRRDDTQGVQTALNTVPTAFGGSGGSLAADGLVGPLTIGAITTFQQRWLTIHDGRCDPRGPTLALLNAMSGMGDALPSGSAGIVAKSGAPATGVGHGGGRGSGPGPFPSLIGEQERIQAAELRQLIVERHHMPELLRMSFVALRVNDRAERHVTRLKALPRGGTLPAAALVDRDRLAFLLVAKTFKLHERNPALAEAGVRRIDSILRQSMLVISTALPPRAPIVSPAPRAPLFVSLFGIPPSRGLQGAAGYVIAGGLHLRPGPSGAFNRFVIPGQVVPERTQRIYLTPLFDRSDLDGNFQRKALLHELAHFVSGAVLDNPPAHTQVDDTAQYKALNSAQRLRLADSYGFFATECAIGTERAVNSCGTTLDTIGEFPKATATFVTDEPTIELPPVGSAQAANFSFPAGFS